MKRLTFNCHGRNAPHYGCSKPGDQSGEYLRTSDVLDMLQEKILKLRMGKHCTSEDAHAIQILRELKLEIMKR